MVVSLEESKNLKCLPLPPELCCSGKDPNSGIKATLGDPKSILVGVLEIGF